MSDVSTTMMYTHVLNRGALGGTSLSTGDSVFTRSAVAMKHALRGDRDTFTCERPAIDAPHSDAGRSALVGTNWKNCYSRRPPNRRCTRRPPLQS
jgi:hypothetical protein